MATTSTNPAESYESYMVPALFALCAARLIGTASPEPGERVLDVACGTGIVARRIAALVGPGGTVTGLDISPHMLEVARSRSGDEGIDIDWQESRAEELPFLDATFDLVTCQFGLMFFADRSAALAEIHRVLSPGGRMALHVFQGIDRHPFYQRLDQVIKDRFDVSGVADIFALGAVDQVRSLCAEAGFTDVDFQLEDIEARFPNPDAFLAGEIDVDTAAIPEMQHLDAGAREEMVKAIAGEMRDALQQVTDGDSVVMPFHTLMALASK